MLCIILSEVYVNDLFSIKQAKLQSYADENMLDCFSMSPTDLMRILEGETCVALTWLILRLMFMNPSKFHTPLIKKYQTNSSGEKITIEGRTIASEINSSFRVWANRVFLGSGAHHLTAWSIGVHHSVHVEPCNSKSYICEDKVSETNCYLRKLCD